MKDRDKVTSDIINDATQTRFFPSGPDQPEVQKLSRRNILPFLWKKIKDMIKRL